MLHRLDRGIRVRRVGDEDHGNPGIDLTKSLVDVQPGEVGQAEVEQDDVRRSRLGLPDPVLASQGHADLMAGPAEDVGQLLLDRAAGLSSTSNTLAMTHLGEGDLTSKRRRNHHFDSRSRFANATAPLALTLLTLLAPNLVGIPAHTRADVIREKRSLDLTPPERRLHHGRVALRFTSTSVSSRPSQSGTTLLGLCRGVMRSGNMKPTLDAIISRDQLCPDRGPYGFSEVSMYNHSSARQLAYGVAFSNIVIAIVIQWYFASMLGDRALYLTFFPAILIAAYLGGFWPGFLATAFAALVVVFFFVEPLYSLRVQRCRRRTMCSRCSS